MNITDLLNLKEKKDLESKITDKYEINYGKKNPFTPITIQGATYKLKTEQYESLIKILKETDTKMEEIQKYDGGNFSKYFGIEIENESITKIQINKYELTSIPPEIGQLTKMQQIYLFNNKITTIPTTIGQLTKLQFLFIEKNPLNSQSEKEIEQLKQKGVTVFL